MIVLYCIVVMSHFQSDAMTNTTSFLFETNQMRWRSIQIW